MYDGSCAARPAVPRAGQPGAAVDSTQESVLPQAVSPAVTSAVEVKATTEVVDSKKTEDDATRTSAVADANIRVGVGLLDKLMDLVGVDTGFEVIAA